MIALLGVVLSYATVAAGAPGLAPAASPAAVDDLCEALHAAGGSACEAPAAPTRDDADYATPAEIDCPAPVAVGASDHLLAGAFEDAPADTGYPIDVCDPPVLDFHYRVSRLPESERPTGALQPQRARRGSRGAACTGLPPDRGTQISTGFVQPAAMYATLRLIPPTAEETPPGPDAVRPSRAIEPLDRPPRA